jgi:hypothetical protein
MLDPPWLDTSYSNPVSNIIQRKEEERMESKEQIQAGCVLRILLNVNYLIILVCFQLFLYT